MKLQSRGRLTVVFCLMRDGEWPTMAKEQLVRVSGRPAHAENGTCEPEYGVGSNNVLQLVVMTRKHQASSLTEANRAERLLAFADRKPHGGMGAARLCTERQVPRKESARTAESVVHLWRDCKKITRVCSEVI